MPKHLTTNDTTNFVISSQLGANNGVAQLGSDGKVPNAQLPTVLTGSVDSVNGQVGNVLLEADDVAAISLSAKGAANGVPQLDSSSRIPVSQLPETVVMNSALGTPGGVATLASNGKLEPTQVPTAPVTSVNGKTGAPILNYTDVGAIPTTQRGAASGVASLDSSTKVPIAQIPSLITLYQSVPSTTPTKPGMVLSAIAGGSNSTQWTEPMVYHATSSGAMPSGVPTGSLCVRTDQKAIYEYISNAWVPVVHPDPGWVDITLPSGTRSYNGGDTAHTPQYKKIGNQVWIRGRIELTAGGNFASGYSITVAGEITPVRTTEVLGTATTASGQNGFARWQLNTNSVMTFFTGSGPNPATPWLGLSISYRID